MPINAMNSVFRMHVPAGRGYFDKQHVFCRCRKTQKGCRTRVKSTGTTPCSHGFADQCKVALSGALLSLFAAVFTPYNASVLASGALSLSPDVPVVSVQGSVLHFISCTHLLFFGHSFLTRDILALMPCMTSKVQMRALCFAYSWIWQSWCQVGENRVWKTS